ncbi:MAG: DJ-1/PfpI family protein, partial [Thermoleophilia bacterium]|nr:DJ-1/PfpI family protein [Thermoleophilia bacterium]
MGRPVVHWQLGILLLLCVVAAPAGAQPSGDPPMSVGILLFDGVQIIDFTGPYEVFGQAGMKVWTASADGEPITTHMDLRITPTHVLDEAPRADILVIPGGNVPHMAPAGDPRVSWIRERAAEAEAVLSVCNGVFFLTSAGLLDGQRATTYAPMLDHLEMAAPNVEVVADERVVDNGKVVTAGGLSAGIDGALHLVSRLLGEPRARAVANNMEYDWQPERAYNRASLADVHIQGVLDLSPPLTKRVDEVYEGSESEWHLRWRIVWPRPVEELQRQFARLAAGAGWQPANVGDPIDWRDSKWVFKDRTGRMWGSRVEITAAPDGEILLAVEVDLAEGPVQGLDAKPCEPRWTFPVPF